MYNVPTKVAATAPDSFRDGAAPWRGLVERQEIASAKSSDVSHQVAVHSGRGGGCDKDISE